MLKNTLMIRWYHNDKNMRICHQNKMHQQRLKWKEKKIIDNHTMFCDNIWQKEINK